jgi:Inner membrane protein CreD
VLRGTTLLNCLELPITIKLVAASKFAATDYALLMGAIALFIVLAIVMYVTRKVDWYARATRVEPSPVRSYRRVDSGGSFLYQAVYAPFIGAQGSH